MYNPGASFRGPEASVNRVSWLLPDIHIFHRHILRLCKFVNNYVLLKWERRPETDFNRKTLNRNVATSVSCITCICLQRSFWNTAACWILIKEYLQKGFSALQSFLLLWYQGEGFPAGHASSQPCCQKTLPKHPPHFPNASETPGWGTSILDIPIYFSSRSLLYEPNCKSSSLPSKQTSVFMQHTAKWGREKAN